MHRGDQRLDVICEDPVGTSSDGTLDADPAAGAPGKGQDAPLVSGSDGMATEPAMKDVDGVDVDRCEAIENGQRPQACSAVRGSWDLPDGRRRSASAAGVGRPGPRVGCLQPRVPWRG